MYGEMKSMESNCPYRGKKVGLINRTDIINHLIEKYNYKSYLEIGVQAGYNFHAVKCASKIGVDPAPCRCMECAGKWSANKSPNVKLKIMSSDQFFDFNYKKFDIVFIDGLHTSEQVYRDFENAVTFLKKGGVILLHDMLPIKKEHQVSHYVHGHWNGDCWKAFVRLQEKYVGWKFNCIDLDEGIGFVRRSDEPLDNTLVKAELNWENFLVNRENWMNPISYEEFVSHHA